MDVGADLALLAVRSVNDALASGLAGAPVAFVVGAISFFTPCILPLLPGYLSFVSGLSGESLEAGVGRRRVLAGTGLFVLGFSLVFTSFGAIATTLGGFLNENHLVFDRVAGAIIIVMGLAFLAPSLARVLKGKRLPGFLTWIESERRPFLTNVKPGLAGAFPLGLAFAVGWTPCVGPGLGTILTLAAGERSAGQGAMLLFFFSLGFGVWFVLGGMAFRRASSAAGWLRRRQASLQLAGGVLLVTIGVLLVSDQWLKVIAPLRRLVVNYSTPI